MQQTTFPQSTPRKAGTKTLMLGILFSLLGFTAISAEQIDVELDAGYAVLGAPVSAGGYELRVSGPDDFFLEEYFAAGTTPQLSLYDAEGYSIDDGIYRWELRSAAPARQRGDAATGTEPRVFSGTVAVSGGSFVEPDTRETINAKTTEIADDLVVVGQACIGSKCSTSADLGSNAIRFMQDNIRLYFDDTSTSTGYPSNDWSLLINAGTNGGDSFFAVRDATAGKNVVYLSAGAPANSLYVAEDGDVGFGTSTPGRDLHVINGDSPTWRMEQDTSMGYPSYTWDVGSNESNFFVRDVGDGGFLPFRILPGAGSNALVIDEQGDLLVGTGTGNTKKAASPIHVYRTDGTAQVLVEEAGSTTADRALLDLQNNGGAAMDLEDTSSGTTWRVQGDASGLHLDAAADGTDEMLVDTSGNVSVAGNLTAVTVTQTSDRHQKTDIVDLDQGDVLARVVDLPVSSWRFKNAAAERHVGPMAQDFHAAFGLGASDRTISPLDVAGVALAAIQGLHEENVALRKQNEDLAQRLASLEAMMTRLTE